MTVSPSSRTETTSSFWLTSRKRSALWVPARRVAGRVWGTGSGDRTGSAGLTRADGTDVLAPVDDSFVVHPDNARTSRQAIAPRLIRRLRPTVTPSGLQRVPVRLFFLLDLVQVRQRPLQLALEVAHAQQTLHPRQQLDLVHRLADEVVGPRLVRLLDVAQLVQRRDHQ